MSLDVQSGKSRKQVWQGKKIDGLSYRIKVYQNAVATVFAATNIDLTDHQLTVELYRKGRWMILRQDSMKLIAAEAGFFNGTWDYIDPGSSGQSLANNLLLQTGAVKAIDLVCLKIPFGGTIDLRGDDKLRVTVQLGGSAFSSAVDTTLSEVSVDVEESDGIEWGVPFVKFEVLTASQNNISDSLPDGTTRVTYINLDKTSMLAAVSCISTANVNAEGMNITDNYEELMTKRAAQFPTKAIADTRRQSFVIYNGKPLRKGTVSLNFTGSNIAASMNYVAVRTLVSDPEVYALAMAQTQLNQVNNAAANGVPVQVPVSVSRTVEAVVSSRKSR